MTRQGTTAMDAIRLWLKKQKLLFDFRVFKWAYNRLGSEYVKMILGQYWDEVFEEQYDKWKRQYGPEIAGAVLSQGGRTGIPGNERRDLGEVRDPR